MKKRSVWILAGLLAASCLFYGCAKPAAPDQDGTKKAEELKQDGVDQNTGNKEGLSSGEVDGEKKNDADADKSPKEEEAKEITYYFVNMESGEIDEATAKIKNESELWDLLKEKGTLTDACALNYVKVNAEEKTMELDFNKACGDWIRGMGSTGETQIIGCIVNSYLDAFQCDSVLVTEDGAEFTTSSGASFQDYTGRIEF